MKKGILSVIAATFLATSSYAGATHMLQAGVGYSNYSYNTGDQMSEAMDDFSYAVVDLGYSVGWESIYININALLPITNGEDSALINVPGVGNVNIDTELERSQYSLNIGYRLGSRFAIFVGTNYADSTVDMKVFGMSDSISLEETGYHLGMAGTLFSVGEAGAVTAKVAISQGELKYDGGSDDSIGYLYGIGWIGFISNNVNYYINLDGYSYTYEPDNAANYESTSMTAKAGVGYTF